MERIRMVTRFWRFGATVSVLTAIALGCEPLQPAAVAQGLGPDTDILYVGDDSDNTIKIFRASDGTSLNGANGAFIAHGGGLHGPMGLLIAGPQLIVDNQNVNLPIGGEISQYQLSNGSFAGTWVSKSDPNAPFAPRGAVIKNGVLYVANLVEEGGSSLLSEVKAFGGDGEFLGAFTPSGATAFHPRGLVVGPDGLLYATSDPCFAPNDGPTVGGQVLRFNSSNPGANGEVFIDDSPGSPSANPPMCAPSAAWVGHLNRPEGLAFGPDGNLYVTSFCAVPSTCQTSANMSDIDSIRIYQGPGGLSPGTLLGQINLDAYAAKLGQTRGTAQALVFGPSGKLFVPITLRPALVGQVVSCDVGAKACSQFTGVGTLGLPFYLTFGRTDSATLAYPE